MARLTQIVVDCTTPSLLARFWAAALDGFEIRAYDDAEIRRLAELALTPETDPVVLVDGPHLEICFQKVDVEPPAKKPMHLDITATNWHEEIERLIALGATVKERFEGHVWMRDPEGNDFCLVDGRERG